MTVYNMIYNSLSKSSSDADYIQASSDKTVAIKADLLERFGLMEENGVVKQMENKSGKETTNSVLSALENAYRE